MGGRRMQKREKEEKGRRKRKKNGEEERGWAGKGVNDKSCYRRFVQRKQSISFNFKVNIVHFTIVHKS